MLGQLDKLVVHREWLAGRWVDPDHALDIEDARIAHRRKCESIYGRAICPTRHSGEAVRFGERFGSQYVGRSDY